MCPLGRGASSFSITNFNNMSIFLTGGRSNGGVLNSVSSYSIAENEWREEPELKHARISHSSCSHGEYVYVFAGMSKHKVSKIRHFVSSVESLKVGSNQEWQVILEHSRLTRRDRPAVAVLSDHTIACFGGKKAF